MCPCCYAALAWTVAGWTTAGGVFSVGIAKVLGWRRRRSCGCGKVDVG